MKRILAVLMILVMLLVFVTPTVLAGPADEPLWTGLRSRTLNDFHGPGGVSDLVHEMLTLSFSHCPPGLAK